MDGDYKTVCTLCDEFKMIMPNDIDIKSYLFETLSLQQLELRLKELQHALELLDERSTKVFQNLAIMTAITTIIGWKKRT